MLWETIDSLNSSKIFSGIIMILLNIGSKYISIDIGRTFDSILGCKIMRRILVFTIVFTATRDILVSTFLTSLFIIFTLYFLNEKSTFCLIPKKYHVGDNEIPKEEIERAKYILKMAEKQNNDKSKYDLEIEKKNRNISLFKKKTKILRKQKKMNNMLTLL